MLLELKVKNFAIIDDIHIEFEEGFNVLSGETGAGKSVLLKSLGLLMGGKASIDFIQKRANQAIIEGLFDIQNRPDVQEILSHLQFDDHDEQLIVRRILNKQGKSKIYINSHIASLQSLQKIVSPLVEITGQSIPLIEVTSQHQNRSLLERSYHLDLLDSFANLWPERRQYKELFQKRKILLEVIDEMFEQNKMREQKLDFLMFQKKELEDFSPQEGEETKLEQDFQRNRHSQKIQELSQHLQYEIENSEHSILAKLSSFQQRLQELQKLDPKLEELLGFLEDAKLQLQELSFNNEKLIDSYSESPDDLEQKAQRLSEFRRLQKKYGKSSSEMLEELEKIKKEIHQLESFDHLLVEKQKELKVIELNLKDLASRMHKKRAHAAPLFAKEIQDEISDLNMKAFYFSVFCQASGEEKATGASDVEFRVANTKTEPAKALHKTASGGELSRLLLAMKQVLGNQETERTYLFDEVDTGVSGPTAEKVGRKLKNISENQQIICVTHLAQVACFADQHFLIAKESSESKTKMNVKKLSEKERISEIARLVSGEKISKTSLAHAKELLKLQEL